MKKRYLSPETEYIDFDVEDIVTDDMELPGLGGDIDNPSVVGGGTPPDEDELG